MMYQGIISQLVATTNMEKGSFIMEQNHPVHSLLINSFRTTICGGVFLTQAHAALIINEVDYDQPGSDAGEFIELFNSGSGDLLLDGFTLDLINGTTGSAYNSFDLTGLTLNAGAYLVLCDGGSTVANCNFEIGPNTGWLQNGGSTNGDAVALYSDGLLIDSMVYEAVGLNLVPFAEGGTSAGDDSNSVIMSLSRLPNGIDTDNNGLDFASGCITPGTANSSGTGDCSVTLPSVPVPAAFWLFGSGLLAMLGLSRKRA